MKVVAVRIGKEDANPFHLILLAMNNVGYENLMRLATLSHLEGFYYKPRIDHELLAKYHAGLIVLSGCFSGELATALQQGQTKQAEEIAKWYKSIFGDRYYIEVQDHEHNWSDTKKLNRLLETLAQKLNIQVVVTSDAHYAQPGDKDAHEVLLCVQTASLLSDDKRMSLKEFDLFVSDPKDIAKRWVGKEAYLANTRAIADRCEVTIEFGRILIPTFPTPKGYTESSYLEEQAYRGLAWRYGGQKRADAAKLAKSAVLKLVDKNYLERMAYELGVIEQMGLSGYFLVVADFINWAKDQGIVVGPGRGSAAGSIVSYSLNITDLDPLEYELLFERFLNPDRISMPDIDIDFQDDRRDEVIRYVEDKYGADRVAHIVTFGTMAARNAIRDTARVLGMPYLEADRLAKMVPPPVQGRHTPLSKHIQKVPELKVEYATNQQTKAVIDLAIRLEGTIRSHGVHAAGVVIAPDELVKFAPLEVAQKGVVATQYSMGPVEDLGLLKMDFLGLSNLTIIKNALRIIRKVHKQDIEVATVPLDDKPTFELLSKGETTGVFQLESAGMKRYIKDLKPNRFDDIVAMVALYRPGPMQWISDYIDRKHGRKQVEYFHPTMANALAPTYGILVYQEQVMQISKDMCGFTGGQADTLRKAIGKKKPEVLAAMKKDFIEGAIKVSKVDRAAVESFWASLEAFAAYCFPKAHAACYGLIAYWTAYLKAHYPTEFMAALLTSNFEDIDRIGFEMRECRDMGIDILPPDINESFVEFGIVPGKPAIRFALSAIKNVGTGSAEAITEERKQGGPYKSIADFAQRLSPQYANRKTWESLIKAGAFDQLAERSDLLFNLDNIVSFASKLHKQTATGQVDLFGAQNGQIDVFKLELAKAPEKIVERERLGWERQLLGVYLSRHPLDSWQAVLDQQATPLLDLSAEHNPQEVTVGGMVTAIRRIITRSGEPMAFVTIEDLTGSIELIVFPKLYKDVSELVDADRMVIVRGRLTTKDREGNAGADLKILAESVKDLEAAQLEEPTLAKGQRLLIKISNPHDQSSLAAMRQILEQHPGSSEVMIQINSDQPTDIRLPVTVSVNQTLLSQLGELFSPEAVLAR